jgi:glutaconate CoA-transferase subunit B
MNKELDYTYPELMAVVLSRDLKDGELGHVGGGGGLPNAAVLLAKKLHAPNITIIVGTTINAKPSALYPAMDRRNDEGLEAFSSCYDAFALTERGFDFMFHSGIQIDRCGNFNLNFTGDDPRRPKMRGPGMVNGGYSVTAKRFYLYQMAHTKRVFVEKVDYISGVGNIDGPDGRKRAGITTQGPVLCITPKAVMDFDQKTGTMRLKSVHEGVTVDDVVQSTGFKLILPDQVATTAPPTQEELEILRNEVDSLGLLRQRQN